MTWPERMAVLEAARDALVGVDREVWAAQSSDLAPVMGMLDELARRSVAAQVVVAAEAQSRGVVAESQCAGVRDWIATVAPATRVTGQAGVLARLVKELARPDAAPVRDRVASAQVAPGVALTVLDQFAKLEPRLAEGVGETVMTAMLDVGAEHGSRAVRELRTMIIAKWGRQGELDAIADSNRKHVELSPFLHAGDGLWESRLVVDDEGKAVIEAAIGPLSRPAPMRDDDGQVIERDLRSAGQRRGQALIEVCRRATAVTASTPSGVKAAVYVTMSLDDLMERTGAGTTMGAFGAGDSLSPETVRRMACDAGIIPAVLDSAGEVVDIGRTKRLFDHGMVKTLWLRDRHCSFPGCSTPAHWCDAHHLWHWADGGVTSTENGALLCPRHHTVVHRDRLLGLVVGGVVEWDLTAGSYDRWLQGRRRDRLRAPA